MTADQCMSMNQQAKLHGADLKTIEHFQNSLVNMKKHLFLPLSYSPYIYFIKCWQGEIFFKQVPELHVFS